jgi:hypothetical protein
MNIFIVYGHEPLPGVAAIAVFMEGSINKSSFQNDDRDALFSGREAVPMTSHWRNLYLIIHI